LPARSRAPTPPFPTAPPKCRDTTFRAIERALASYCRGRTGRGVHGSCADWLKAYGECGAVDFERAAPGWNIVLRLFDCHDPVIAVIPDGKRWRVRDVTLRSYLPPSPNLPGSAAKGEVLELELEVKPSPSPSR
jgi:hypothetical protein